MKSKALKNKSDLEVALSKQKILLIRAIIVTDHELCIKLFILCNTVLNLSRLEPPASDFEKSPLSDPYPESLVLSCK